MFKFRKLDFTPGKITYDTFDFNPSLPPEEQLDSLREDLFQVSYGGEYTIDIGWLPHSNPKGSFVIQGIQGYDWDEPIYCKRTKSLDSLDKFVQECANIIKELLTKKYAP